MSHVVAQKAHIKSLEALKRSCKALGLEFMQDQTTYKWYGTWAKDYHEQDAAYKLGYKPEDYGKCLHAIRVPGKKGDYEVGVVAARDANGKLIPGEYDLIADFWSGGHGLMAAVSSNGKNCNRITQQYMIEQSKIRAQHLTQQGWTSKVEVLPDGVKVLRLKEPG